MLTIARSEPAQSAATNKANVDSLLMLTHSTVGRVERLVALNLKTVRTVVEDSVLTTKALIAVKSPQDFVVLQVTMARPFFDNAVIYSRSVYQLAAEGPIEAVQLFDAKRAQLSKTVAVIRKTVPARSEAVLTAVKSVITGGGNAYDTVVKATKQWAVTAETKVSTATKATIDAVRAKVAA